jgi:hypothetical protein
MDSAPVRLYVYDLSGGVARALSPSLLGIQIDAVYHTSIVVRGIEHYFGGGINVAMAGTTPFGHQPMQVVDLGETCLSEDIIEGLLIELSTKYTPENYSLLSNNCNSFSNELSQLLTGNSIPEHITGLPETVLTTPFGQMLRPLLQGLEQQMKNMRSQAFTPQHYHETASVPSTNRNEESRVQPSVAAVAVETTMEEGPAVLAAEKELEAAVAECAILDMNQRLEELDLKEGRATPAQQLGEEGAARLAAETAIKRELDEVISETTADIGDVDIKEAEALAVEHVAASGKLKAPSSPRSPRRHT